jgi:hypothetical protein
LTLEVPAKIKAGDYQVVLVIGEPIRTITDEPLPDLPVIHVNRWPEDLSLRREDLYGDTAR